MMKTARTGERRSAAQMHALAAVRREIVSRDSSGRGKYLREYAQAFRRYEAVLTAGQLEQKIAAADILLVGDYHALAASQRYAVTLIEQIAHSRPLVLCVEAVLARDQQILDSWWRREIGEEELRKRLRFDRDWGYEWEPFCELLSSARDHGEGIYGLDCMPRDDMRRIRSRDRHAAAKIAEVRRQHPDAAIVVLFGESHMAPEHLPRLVKETLPSDSVLTILQNVDALYWQAVGENAAAVATGTETVCVFNSSPLEKYESYRLCLERWNSDEQTDFAPAVHNVIFSLARALGFRLDSPTNGTQPKYLSDSLPEVVNVAEEGAELEDFAEPLARAAQAMLDQNGCCYLAETNRFLIREFNMPSVAAEAARFLRRACQGMERPRAVSDSAKDDALARFGSRLLSPGTTPDALPGHAEGEKLYADYLEGRITKAAARRLFLGAE